MKNIVLALLILASSFLIGCSSRSEVDALRRQNADLQKQVVDLQKQINISEGFNKSLRLKWVSLEASSFQQAITDDWKDCLRSGGTRKACNLRYNGQLKIEKLLIRNAMEYGTSAQERSPEYEDEIAALEKAVDARGKNLKF